MSEHNAYEAAESLALAAHKYKHIDMTAAIASGGRDEGTFGLVIKGMAYTVIVRPTRYHDTPEPTADLAALREAAQAVAITHCRQWLDTDDGYVHCNAPAEFVLWGKLIKPEGLGPRCYEHAARHVGDRALGDPSWAIIDLRPLRAVLASADSESREETP